MMFNIYSMLLMVCTGWTVGSPEIETKRSKRLVWGVPLTEFHAYAAVGYYAYITYGSRFSYAIAQVSDLFTAQLPIPLPNPTEGSLRCGGALITESAVQSACHCFSRYRRVNLSYHEAEVLNGWENWSSVFLSLTKVSDMREEGIWSRLYIIHPKCAMLMQNTLASYTHDYGVVVLNKNVKFRLLHQKFPPTFSKADLFSIYYNIIRHGQVCLHIGFGAYYWKKPGIVGTASPLLQHGWRAVTSYWNCFWRIFIHHQRNYLLDYGMRYTDLATWVCTEYFGRERATPLPGDSGSPVTCDNQYVGIISFRDLLHTHTQISTDYFASTAFSVQENALEYRGAFVRYINVYREEREWHNIHTIQFDPETNWGSFFAPDGTNDSVFILKKFNQKWDLRLKTDSSFGTRITTVRASLFINLAIVLAVS